MVFLPTTLLDTSLKSISRPMEFFSRVGETTIFFLLQLQNGLKNSGDGKNHFPIILCMM